VKTEEKTEDAKSIEAAIEEVSIVKTPLLEEDREISEAEIDVETAFEALKKKIEEIKTREKVTQQKFRDQPDMSIAILKKILQKWDLLREEVRKGIAEVIDKCRRLKTMYEARFSRLEEELYFNQIELDTLRELEEQGEPISISKKEELERMVPELVKELAKTNEKYKEIDAKIEQLKRMNDNIYEVTAYKDLAVKLYEEMATIVQERRGEEALPALRAQIDSIAQREGIPREYATIYVYKKLLKK
jgi:predicted patatin/cPLA2 family phospholipase